MSELQNRLCADKELSCAYVSSLFADDRLTIFTPPEQAPAPTTHVPRERERNPYLTKRFGLLTAESLERCRSFVQAHEVAFDTAHTLYGVPKEVVCGHLRIETDFGIPTGLSPHPLGTIPALDRLVTLYVRKGGRKQTTRQFVHRQAFALTELKDLLRAASANDWNLFELPGSSTGAIGLVQFEPSSFNVAVDGNGDHKIDLFDPDDAILSVAHYLSTRGWDDQPLHQRRAIYAYYGGNYNSDPRKYYMKAVLQYAQGMREYFQDHPVAPAAAAAAVPQSGAPAGPAPESRSFAFIGPHAN
jgi:membrane-bound lytic murein transglycosylase B